MHRNGRPAGRAGGRSAERATARREGERQRERQALSFAVDQAWRTLEHTGRSIDRADAKAAAVLAASGGVGVILYNLGGEHSAAGLWSAFGLGLSAVLTLTAAVFAGVALRPRRAPGTTPLSLVYFDHIAHMPDPSAAGYVSRVSKLFLEPEELCRDLGTQVWATGQIAATKFGWVSRALSCMLAALCATGVTAVIIGL